MNLVFDILFILVNMNLSKLFAFNNVDMILIKKKVIKTEKVLKKDFFFKNKIFLKRSIQKIFRNTVFGLQSKYDIFHVYI